MATKESFVAALEDETQSCEKLIGSSEASRKVLKQIELVASSNATVLITGESGTGKELVARAIHAKGTRQERPFIEVNCAAIATELFESEFFGHTRGAFTGAHKDRTADSALRRVGPSFSMRSVRFRFPSRANCCESCRKVNMSA